MSIRIEVITDYMAEMGCAFDQAYSELLDMEKQGLIPKSDIEHLTAAIESATVTIAQLRLENRNLKLRADRVRGNIETEREVAAESIASLRGKIDMLTQK